MIDLLLSAMACAIGVFSLYLLHTPPRSYPLWPLSLLLCCLIFLACGPLIFASTVLLQQLYIALLPLVFYTLLPSLWLYHEVLIAQEPWGWRKKASLHFLLLPFAAALSLLIMLLPSAEFTHMFFAERPVESFMAQLAAVSFLVLLVVWCFLSFVYVVSIFKRTVDYHWRIKQMYANEQGKSLRWVIVISLLLMLAWVYALAVLVVEDRFQQYGFSGTGVFLWILVLVWLIAANGLRQQPGFAEVFAEAHPQADELHPKAEAEHQHDATLTKAKYQRSALTSDDFTRITAKLMQAITQDALHLDEDVNLMKLAKHTGIPSQYIRRR